MAGLFHQHNRNYYIIFNTFSIYIVYLSPTGKNVEPVSMFLEHDLYLFHFEDLNIVLPFKMILINFC